jgi:hypothetical protein
MPVVPLLRTAEIAGEHKIISTDLKADGSELYGKALISAILDDEDPRERPPARELDDAFVKLTDPERIAEVEERLRALADQATENYLRLPFDDPFELQIHPDGSWEPIILDLRFAYVTAPEKRTEDTRARLEMENSFAVEKYLGFVAELREVMLDHPEKLQQD